MFKPIPAACTFWRQVNQDFNSWSGGNDKINTIAQIAVIRMTKYLTKRRMLVNIQSEKKK